MTFLPSSTLQCAPSVCIPFQLDSLLRLVECLEWHDHIFPYDKVRPIDWPTELRSPRLMNDQCATIKVYRGIVRIFTFFFVHFKNETYRGRPATEVNLCYKNRVRQSNFLLEILCYLFA